jgi:hypothetical protein
VGFDTVDIKPDEVSKTGNYYLEDLDLLFARESYLSWRAEREFAQVNSKEAEHVEYVGPAL